MLSSAFSEDRSDLLAFLSDEYATTSALYSMPSVFILLIVYIFFVTSHIDVTNSWRERNTFYHNLDSLWKLPRMANRCALGLFPPFFSGVLGLFDSRYGAKAHMEWTSNKWLPTYYRQNLVTDPHPGRVAMQNQMIGGSRLHREWYQTGGNEAHVILLERTYIYNRNVHVLL